MTTFKISAVTRSQVDALHEKLMNSHAAIVTSNGDESKIIGHGVVADAWYDEPTKTLTISILSHPFYADPEVIEARLRKLIAVAQPVQN